MAPPYPDPSSLQAQVLSKVIKRYGEHPAVWGEAGLCSGGASTIHLTQHTAHGTQHTAQHAARSTQHIARVCTCCVHMHMLRAHAQMLRALCCVHMHAAGLAPVNEVGSWTPMDVLRKFYWEACRYPATLYADTLTPYTHTLQPYTHTLQPYTDTPQPYDTLQPYADTLQPYADTLQAYARLQPHLAEAATPRVPAATVCTKAAAPRRVSSPQPSWHPRRMAWCAPVRRTGCSWSTPRSAGGRLARYVSSGGEVGKVRDEQGSK